MLLKWNSAACRGSSPLLLRTLNSAKLFKCLLMKMQFSHYLISNQCCFLCLSSWLGRTAGQCHCSVFLFRSGKKQLLSGTMSGKDRNKREQFSLSLEKFGTLNQIRNMTFIWLQLICRGIRKIRMLLPW